MKKIIYTFLIIAIVLAAVYFANMVIFKSENPLSMIKAIKSLNQGREYEIIREESVYLTKSESYVDLIHFLEGHYGYYFLESNDHNITFDDNGQEMKFDFIPILGKYKLWKKI